MSEKKNVERITSEDFENRASVIEMEFADHYLISFNIRESAEAVGRGYNWGHSTLNKPHVHAYLLKRLRERRKTRDLDKFRLIEELKQIAFANPSDFFDWNGEGEIHEDGTVDVDTRIRWRGLKDIGRRAVAIKSIKETHGKTWSKQLVFHDKLEAIKTLLDIYANEEQSAVGKVDPTLLGLAKLTPEERAKRIQFLKGLRTTKTAKQLHDEAVKRHERQIIDKRAETVEVDEVDGVDDDEFAGW
jgi:phage terminase small subunit